MGEWHGRGGRGYPEASRLAKRTKRIVDICGSTALLVLLAPAIGAVAVAVARDLGRPVLFRQPRPGLDGTVFTLIKFRTMRPLAHGQDSWDSNEDRVTPLGRFLRRSSLDELPELVCVLKGDMSLVGPRPLLVEYLPRYSESQSRRHLVRPGMTGLAQVSGRRSLVFSERLALDVEYVDSWSLGLDVRILLRTVATALWNGEVRGQLVRDVDDLGLLGTVGSSEVD